MIDESGMQKVSTKVAEPACFVGIAGGGAGHRHIDFRTASIARTQATSTARGASTSLNRKLPVDARAKMQSCARPADVRRAASTRAAPTKDRWGGKRGGREMCVDTPRPFCYSNRLAECAEIQWGRIPIRPGRVRNQFQRRSHDRGGVCPRGTGVPRGELTR